MHDLRRQALESGKTTSRKARSKQASPASSRPNSAPPSRAASRTRAVSKADSDDDETGNLSDETSFSTNSIDELLNGYASDPITDAWRTDLADRIQELLDRKRSSVQGRERCLASYVRTLTAQYAEEDIRGKEAELVVAFLKSIKAETSEKETILAMKALSMTVITSPSDLIYEAVCGPLKRIIADSTSVPNKAAAVHCLGICTFFGGASDDEILDNMAYLLEIVASDGSFIDAQDEVDPVVAALEEWGALSTLIDDLEGESEEAVEYFVEQLSSSDPGVQIAAGENIALLYEKSYRPLTEDDGGDFSETDIISDPDDTPGVPKLVKNYDVYRRIDVLKDTLSDLASLNTHRLSKKEQKAIRTSFADILDSVEYPTHGPRYQNAISQDTGKRYGSRMSVRIHQDGVMKIDKWWKLHRLQALRRVLQSGFVSHYEHNPIVFESLPYTTRPAPDFLGPVAEVVTSLRWNSKYGNPCLHNLGLPNLHPLESYWLEMDPESGAYRFQTDHWDDNRSPELIAVSVILILATCIVIAFRFWAQYRIGKQWEADNILIVFAAIDSTLAFRIGVGKHLVRVLESDPHKPRDLIRILKSAYAITLLQGICLGLIKFSILLFYRRIFTMHRRTFQITFYLLGTYTILLTIATFLLYLLNCLPFGFFWEVAYMIAKIPPPHPVNGHCLPDQKDLARTSIASTISDVALMLLPAIGLWKLSLPRAKKVGLFCVFSLGAFQFTLQETEERKPAPTLQSSMNQKLTNFAPFKGVNADLVIWTAVECCVGTICASLPTLAPLLKRPQQPGSSKPHTCKSWARFPISGLTWPRWLSIPSHSRLRDAHTDDDGTGLQVLPLKERTEIEICSGQAADDRWGAWTMR
ncbi:MAG: hypothetical protein Q9186_002415 [Xanthomendoza sp. 1 TL-2023]